MMRRADREVTDPVQGRHRHISVCPTEWMILTNAR